VKDSSRPIGLSNGENRDSLRRTIPHSEDRERRTSNAIPRATLRVVSTQIQVSWPK